MVDVGLTQSTYAAVESEQNAAVCATLTGQIARVVSVTLTTTDGSASSDSDYVAILAEEKVFQPMSQNIQEVCWRISIEDDELFEEMETFSVTLRTTDQHVVLNPSSADVVIHNNNSKSTGINYLSI